MTRWLSIYPIKHLNVPEPQHQMRACPILACPELTVMSWRVAFRYSRQQKMPC